MVGRVSSIFSPLLCKGSPMVTLKWSLNKYVVMFLKWFSILDKGSNRADVDGDHCWLIILYVVFYYCLLEHVEKHFENLRKHHANAMITF